MAAQRHFARGSSNRSRPRPRLIPRLGHGMPEPPVATPIVTARLAALLGHEEPDLRRAVAQAESLHPSLAGSITALMGSTLAPTMLMGSNKRNVMPARASTDTVYAVRIRSRLCGVINGMPSRSSVGAVTGAQMTPEE